MTGEEMTTPMSLTIEEAVLGCMFLDREAAMMGCGALTGEDFFYPAHRDIFEAFCGLDPAEGTELPMIWHELEKAGKAESIGLDRLAKISLSVGSSINLPRYIEDLQRLSYLRRTIESCRKMTQAAYRQDVAECQREMERLTGDGYGHRKMTTLADAFAEYIREISEQRSSGRKLIGLETGFSHLNYMTGGFRNGEMIVLAARPSMGKSALALDIGRAAQKSLRHEGKTVVFFSLEMPAKALGGRGYTAEYRKPNDAFSIGANDQNWKATLQEIERNAKHFTDGSGGMILNEEGSLTIDQLRAACHGYKAGGRKIGLVIVDYLQLITVRGENRVQEIGAVSRGLKLLAKDMDCPVLVLSQLSRKNEERADKKPMLSDLRDSGAIEQDADVVLFLHREEYYFPDTEKKNTADLIIAKQRNGPTGSVELVWMPECTTFRTKEVFQRTEEELPELFGGKG